MRQSGQTTRQMREASEGAVYVWCNGVLSYPRYLASYLGRTDLEIVPPNALDNHGLMYNPQKEIVVDHAAVLDSWRSEMLYMLQNRYISNGRWH